MSEQQLSIDRNLQPLGLTIPHPGRVINLDTAVFTSGGRRYRLQVEDPDCGDEGTHVVAVPLSQSELADPPADRPA